MASTFYCYLIFSVSWWHLRAGRSFFNDSISLLVIGLLRLSFSSWFIFGRLCVSRNFPLSSRLSNLLAYLRFWLELYLTIDQFGENVFEYNYVFGAYWIVPQIVVTFSYFLNFLSLFSLRHPLVISNCHEHFLKTVIRKKNL